MSPTRKLPPSERDFDIYEAAHVAQRSTRFLAAQYKISQTRVRQIVGRVVQWLAEVLPPKADIDKEKEVYLARQIAADRFQHQLEDTTELWDSTRDTRYAGLRIRLTLAQARLGVVGGLLGCLAANAIDGPEPLSEVDQAAEPNREGEAAEPALPPALPPSLPPSPWLPLSPSSPPPPRDCSPAQPPTGQPATNPAPTHATNHDAPTPSDLAQMLKTLELARQNRAAQPLLTLLDRAVTRDTAKVGRRGPSPACPAGG
jgi:hypothetical protein